MNPPPLEFQVADPEVLASKADRRRTEGRDRRNGDRKARVPRPDNTLWDWVLNSNPIAGMLVADLSEEQKADVRAVLDGMLRERSGGNGAAVLTNPVHIGIGTK